MQNDEFEEQINLKNEIISMNALNPKTKIKNKDKSTNL